MEFFRLVWIVAAQVGVTPTAGPTSASGAASQADGGATAGIIAAVIAAVALIGSTILTQWLQFRLARQAYADQKERDAASFHHQITRERAAAQQAIRAEQRQRFYPAAMVVFNAALEYQSVAHQSGYVLAGEDVQSRNLRLDASLKQALAGVNEAMLTLTFDATGSRLDVVFRGAQRAYNQYMRSLEPAPPGLNASPDQHALDTLDAQVQEITTLIQTRLQQLEEPQE